MKLSYLFLPSILFLIASCSSDDSEKFAGEWQSISDPSKQINIIQTGNDYVFQSPNIESPFEGLTGNYNNDKNAIEFDNGTGTITMFVYNDANQHILALGDEFEKASDAEAVTDEDIEITGDATHEEETNDIGSEPVEESNTSDSDAGSKPTSKCGKGEAMIISGNNVRLRTEPDITKQNILLQMNKGNEVVHLGDKAIDGQKWYKVCYDGNIGWVSGQYAALK